MERNMNARTMLALGASVCATALAQGVPAAKAQQPYVRVAEIEIDPARLEAYKAMVHEQIEAAVRLEPGVLALYAVSQKDNPTHIIVFEMYADMEAYQAHLETPHFKKYKTDTQDIVKSLKLLETVPIVLGAKPR
jgi:quinol monooxygenase YgiN